MKSQRLIIAIVLILVTVIVCSSLAFNALVIHSPENESVITENYALLNYSSNESNIFYEVYGGANSDESLMGLLYTGNSTTYNWTAPVITSDSGLVVLMHFNNQSAYGENSTRVYDFSGNGNNGTVVDNFIKFSNEGKFSGAYKFNNSGDYISINYSDSLNFTKTNQLTVTGWVNVSSDLLGLNCRFVDRNGWFKLYPRKTGIYFAVWNESGDATVLQPTTDSNVDEWHHFTGVFNGTHLIYYRDGTYVASTSFIGGTIRDYPGPLLIGQLSNCTIDELAIYNRSLSADEISNLSQLSLGAHYYWKLRTVNISNSSDFTDEPINSFFITELPTINSVRKSPVVVYENDQNVTFYANVTKGSYNLSSVLIEGNWSGTLENYTMDLVSNDTYSYTISNVNFKFGEIYQWKIYINDTNNYNSSTNYTYTFKIFDPEDIKPIAVLYNLGGPTSSLEYNYYALDTEEMLSLYDIPYDRVYYNDEIMPLTESSFMNLTTNETYYTTLMHSRFYYSSDTSEGFLGVLKNLVESYGMYVSVFFPRSTYDDGSLSAICNVTLPSSSDYETINHSQNNSYPFFKHPNLHDFTDSASYIKLTPGSSATTILTSMNETGATSNIAVVNNYGQGKALCAGIYVSGTKSTSSSLLQLAFIDDAVNSSYNRLYSQFDNPIFVNYIVDDPPVDTAAPNITFNLTQMIDVKFTYAAVGYKWNTSYNNHSAYANYFDWFNSSEKNNINHIGHSYSHACAYDCDYAINGTYVGSGACSFNGNRSSQEEDINRMRYMFNTTQDVNRTAGTLSYFVVPCGGFSEVTLEILKDYGYKAVWGNVYKRVDGSMNISYTDTRFMPYFMESEEVIPLLRRSGNIGSNLTNYSLKWLAFRDLDAGRPIVMYGHSPDWESMEDNGTVNVLSIDSILEESNETYYYLFADEAIDYNVAVKGAKDWAYNHTIHQYNMTGKNLKVYYAPYLGITVYKNGVVWLGHKTTYPQRIWGEGAFTLKFENNSYPRLREMPSAVNLSDISYSASSKKLNFTVGGVGTDKTFIMQYNVTGNFYVYDNSNIFATVSGGVLDSSSSNYNVQYNYSTGILNFTIPSMSNHEIIVEEYTPTESSSSSSSSSGGLPVFLPTPEQMQQGYERALMEDWKIQFKYNNKTHSINLDSIDGNMATITVSSNTVTFSLTVGDVKKLDLDNDNSYDLQIFLKDITNNKANFFVKLVSEEISEEGIIGEDTGNATNYAKGEQAESEKSYNKLIILGAILLILIIALIVFLKMKFFDEKDSERNKYLSKI